LGVLGETQLQAFLIHLKVLLLSKKCEEENDMKYYRPPKDPGMYSKGDFPYIPGIETINPALGRGSGFSGLIDLEI